MILQILLHLSRFLGLVSAIRWIAPCANSKRHYGTWKLGLHIFRNGYRPSPKKKPLIIEQDETRLEYAVETLLLSEESDEEEEKQREEAQEEDQREEEDEEELEREGADESAEEERDEDRLEQGEEEREREGTRLKGRQLVNVKKTKRKSP
jgi:hypothetical protein